jgi:hypothetical protein
LISQVEEPIHAFYEIISGFASQPRDWARLRALFIPEARIVPGSVVNGSNPICAVEVDAYIEKLAGFLNQHDFFETGAVQKIEVYSRIASVISTYEARCTPGNPAHCRHDLVRRKAVNGHWAHG